jgi:hypothetical protein
MFFSYFFPSFVGKAKVKNQGLFYLYLEAVSIMNSKSQSLSEDSQDGKSSSTRGASSLNIQSFTSRDLEFIVKFAEEHGSDIFRQILHSICPSIYGHELVKGDYHSLCYYFMNLLEFLIYWDIFKYLIELISIHINFKSIFLHAVFRGENPNL